MFRIIRSRLSFDGILPWNDIGAAENFVCEASDEGTARLIARALNEHDKLLTNECDESAAQRSRNSGRSVASRRQSALV